MSQIPTNRLRLQIDLTSPGATVNNRADTLTNPPSIYRKSIVRIEIGLYSSGVILADFTGVSTIACGFQDAAILGTWLATNVTPAAPTNTLTDPQWTAGDPANYHAAFTLSQAQTNIGIANKFQAALVVYTIDALGNINPIAVIPVTVLSSGV